ncbi:hypothetical protein ACQEUU_11925 [Nonomuraea sp. CA-218870]
MTTFPRPEDPDAALRAAVEQARKDNKPVAVEDAYTKPPAPGRTPTGT